ncbi:unnamed protein product [Adineta ricciae]|uniref:G-protein coupled receptors family 1 profile domain-containing protein n=1 Tax=Adineta ricciae TaxID=249248 RepID=A0A815B115_ADIRI|nr:unnamed protein product [Adineta ricciae]
MTLFQDAQQLSLYAGLFLLVFGIIGNGINILVFTKVRIYRINPCTFYFLMGSIDNLFYICLNLPIRILIVSFQIDVIGSSDIWCKIRNFLLTAPSLISITFSCLATIDQFFVTSKSAFLRNCSQIKWAHRISILVIIFWCVYCIHIFFVVRIVPSTKVCTSDNPSYLVYSAVYLLAIICGIPVGIMTLFGILTYRNIRQTIRPAELHYDRQLIRMTLIHVALVAVSLIPYGINNAYSLVTAGTVKNLNQQMIEYLVSTITTLGTYLYYVGSCYTFLLTSNRFRQRVKKEIIYWHRKNTIGPA